MIEAQTVWKRSFRSDKARRFDIRKRLLQPVSIGIAVIFPTLNSKCLGPQRLPLLFKSRRRIQRSKSEQPLRTEKGGVSWRGDGIIRNRARRSSLRIPICLANDNCQAESRQSRVRWVSRAEAVGGSIKSSQISNSGKFLFATTITLGPLSLLDPIQIGRQVVRDRNHLWRWFRSRSAPPTWSRGNRLQCAGCGHECFLLSVPSSDDAPSRDDRAHYGYQRQSELAQDDSFRSLPKKQGK